MTDLTDKQKAFVAEYLIDLNATQAAIRAGYSSKTAGPAASRLLKNVKVAEAIRAAKDQRTERTEITADYVLTSIVETMQQCKPKGKYNNPGAVLKGAELLGKHKGLFEKDNAQKQPVVNIGKEDMGL